MHRYATHLPVLKTISSTRKVRSVLEFGGGDFSTPTFLNRIYYPDLEILITVENNRDWRKKLRQLKDKRIVVLKTAPNDVEPDLILIDDGQNWRERVKTIDMVRRTWTDVPVVLHDFEVSEYQREARHWKNWRVFTHIEPWTAVLWNEGWDPA